jgi:hypothetical protein
MKKKDSKFYVIIAVLLLLPLCVDAQDLVGTINNWKRQLKLVLQAVIGLAALGGGAMAFLKVQSSGGDEGKKAIGVFITALIFGAVLFAVIEFFIPS